MVTRRRFSQSTTAARHSLTKKAINIYGKAFTDKISSFEWSEVKLYYLMNNRNYLISLISNSQVLVV